MVDLVVQSSAWCHRKTRPGTDAEWVLDSDEAHLKRGKRAPFEAMQEGIPRPGQVVLLSLAVPTVQVQKSGPSLHAIAMVPIEISEYSQSGQSHTAVDRESGL